MMNLAFLLFKYFPYGGLQRDFLRIMQECRRRGHAATVYVLSWDGPIPEGVDVRIVPARARSNHRRVQQYFRWVDAALSAEPDTVRVGFNKMPGLDFYYAADACYKEKSLTQRGFLYRTGARYRLYERFERAVFSEDSKTELLMISKAQTPLFVKHYGTPAKRMHFLPPNISRDRVAPSNAADIRADFRKENGFDEDVKLLVQVGSGFIKKGVDRSIRALASLPLALREKSVYWVVGKDRSARSKRLARRLGVEKQVFFMGGRDDIPRILLGADLMIHPAYDENTGTVLLEAVASGLPVLCTEVCGYSSHIVAADCGAVSPSPFEQRVLNRQLEQLLKDGHLVELGRHARTYARTTDLYSMHERAADVILKTAVR